MSALEILLLALAVIFLVLLVVRGEKAFQKRKD